MKFFYSENFGFSFSFFFFLVSDFVCMCMTKLLQCHWSDPLHIWWDDGVTSGDDPCRFIWTIKTKLFELETRLNQEVTRISVRKYNYSQGDAREGGFLWSRRVEMDAYRMSQRAQMKYITFFLVQSKIPCYLLFEMKISGFLQIVALGLLIKHKLRNFRLSHYWPKHGP